MRHSVSDVSKPEAPKPLENKATVELDEEEENIWESMAVVSDKIRKKKVSGVPTNKNKRQKIEVSMHHFNYLYGNFFCTNNMCSFLFLLLGTCISSLILI